MITGRVDVLAEVTGLSLGLLDFKCLVLSPTSKVTPGLIFLPEWLQTWRYERETIFVFNGYLALCRFVLYYLAIWSMSCLLKAASCVDRG